MISLMNFTCAFLIHDEKMLLMKRGADRAINPNFWSGVGGKMEANEINSPYEACLREMNEETRLSADDLYDLSLKYIIIRRHKDAIRQSYIYFGTAKTNKISCTDEGELFWIPNHDILNRTFTATYTEMLKHYLSEGQQTQQVVVGVAENRKGQLQMSWSLLEDFE